MSRVSCAVLSTATVEDTWAKAGLGGSGRMGEGFRFTYSWMASKAQVSKLLNVYLLETRAMSINGVKSVPGVLSRQSSGGLVVL